jgi:hypothetical protein
MVVGSVSRTLWWVLCGLIDVAGGFRDGVLRSRVRTFQTQQHTIAHNDQRRLRVLQRIIVAGADDTSMNHEGSTMQSI